MGLGRASVVVVAIALGARAREPKPLAERIDAATKAAMAARGLVLRAPLRVREVSVRELAVALGEEPVAEQGTSAVTASEEARSASSPAPMVLDDDLARACLLGLRPPEACVGRTVLAKPNTPHGDGPSGADLTAGGSAASALASLAAGVYLPAERTLLVRRDEGGAADATVLLHETVHALQDAHFSLAPMLRADRRGADALAARHAFVEGDATFAVIRDANLLEPVDGAFVEAFCRGFVMANRKAVRALEASPSTAPGANGTALADSVVAPYVHGTRFVWSLYARGGWRAVNAAWKRPPESTEQLLHPAKYLRRERPVPLPLAPAPPAGFEPRGSAVFGELDLRTWLASLLGEEEATRLAAGWGNGGATLYERGDARALTLRVRWDDDARGRSMEVAAKVSSAVGGACAERDELGPITVDAVGRDLVVHAGPAGARCPALGARDRRGGE